MVKIKLGSLSHNCILPALLLLMPTILFSATITVKPDRTLLHADETFYLEFNSDGEVDGKPNFTPLKKDFKITNRSQSSNLQIINGKVTRSGQWSLSLLPKRSGTITIPKIKFGKDESNSIRIVVKSASITSTKGVSGNLHLEATVTPKSAYIQSQVIYSVRIYQAVNLVNAKLSDLKINDNDAIIEKLGEDSKFEKTINGKRYIVFEKRFAVFPQKSGQLVFQPMQLEAQFIDNRRSIRTKYLKTKKLTVDIQAKPSLKTLSNNKPWLPARDLEIIEEWVTSPPVFKEGEPVTVTLTTIADGLSASQLPEISYPDIPTIKQYPDQSVAKNQKITTGITGIRQQKIALIPTKAGEYKIPEIAIPWWNVIQNTLEIARIEERTINVANNPATTTSASQSSDLNISMSDKLKADMTSTQVENKFGYGNNDLAHFWYWYSGLITIAWLITLFFLVKHRRKDAYLDPEIDTGQRNPQNYSASQVIKSLKNACRKNDTRKSKRALIDWATIQWKDSAPKNLGALAKLCEDPFKQEIMNLNEVLYKNNDNVEWSGNGLWLSFSDYIENQKDEQSVEYDSIIEPLYRSYAKT